LTIEGATIPTVCIDCRYIGERPSGIAEVVQGLVDHVPSLAPDLTFRLLTSPERTKPLSTAANVTEHPVSAGSNSPVGMWFLPELARLSQSDVFHATANILPARLKMKTVTTVHDIMWLTHPQWCDATAYGHVKRRFFAHGIRRALTLSDRLAPVSAATGAALLEHNPALEGRIRLTRSGVADRFKPVARDSSTLAKFGIERGKRYALVVGQFAPYKNHEAALRAFASGIGDQGDARLIFVQRRGPNSASLGKLARQLGIDTRVHVAGGVSNEELLQLYSSARVLLHPSLCEGFGNPVAEAMACGCPVITSNRSAMPEVAGGAARLIDPQDENNIATALREIWHNREARKSMREAGIKRAAELRWVDFAQANVAIYRSLLGET